MQEVLEPRSASPPTLATTTQWPDTTSYAPCITCIGQEWYDAQFVEMLDSYRASGGLARVRELLAWFKRTGGPEITALAGWISERRVLCFEWQSQIWFPWFQFKHFDEVPDPRLQLVFVELIPVFDPWELATWFALPNAWLAERAPVVMLATDLPAVLHAARADRFIAKG